MPAQTVIKLRRDTSANWTSVDPILATGELGVETDTNRIKIGDGATEWTGLNYGPVSDNLHIRVKNASGSVAIPAGRLVQFAGAAGDTVTASPAVTDGSVDFHLLIGVTAAEIAADGFGDVVLTGVVGGIDTSSYTAGTLLYADDANPGQLTDTAPTAPSFSEPVAAVTRSGAGTSGLLLVRLHLGASLNDIHDVTLASVASGQVLQFDGTKWVNADALPDQAGQSGKYLTTDGTDTSWDVVSYNELTNVPSSFTPSAHAATHADGGSDEITISQSQVTNLTTDLSNKANVIDLSPVGVINMWPTTSAPTDWLICDGSEVSRSTYSALFSVLGTTYGSGNGSTTFNLPNLKGRVPVGLDSAQDEFNSIGETGGEKEHQLTISELAAHTHNQSNHTHSYTGLVYQWGTGLVPESNTFGYVPTTSSTGGNYSPLQGTGGGESHNNLQPYIALNYIIKAV